MVLTARARRTLKVAVFVAALVPVALLVRGMLTGNLGVNPAETIQLTTGRLALKFLLVTLAITPARRLTGCAAPWDRPSRTGGRSTASGRRR